MSGHQSGPTLRLNVFRNLKIGKVVGLTLMEEGASIGEEMVGYLRVTSVCQKVMLPGGANVLRVEGELIESPVWEGTTVELRYYLRNKHMLMLRR